MKPVQPHGHKSFSDGGKLDLTGGASAFASTTVADLSGVYAAVGAEIDYIGSVLVTGVPSAGATIIGTSATTAQWATGGAVTIYWPLLCLSSVV